MKHFIFLVFALMISMNTSAQEVKKDNYQIEGVTIAITDMELMLKFYTEVFEIEFTEIEMFESKLYSGVWGGLNLLFCPAAVARNSAKQNRHQFDIVVPDLTALIDVATKNGGELIGEITENEGSRSIGIYDPDKNSILFKQLN